MSFSDIDARELGFQYVKSMRDDITSPRAVMCQVWLAHINKGSKPVEQNHSAAQARADELPKCLGSHRCCTWHSEFRMVHWVDRACYYTDTITFFTQSRFATRFPVFATVTILLFEVWSVNKHLGSVCRKVVLQSPQDQTISHAGRAFCMWRARADKKFVPEFLLPNLKSLGKPYAPKLRWKIVSKQLFKSPCLKDNCLFMPKISSRNPLKQKTLLKRQQRLPTKDFPANGQIQLRSAKL